MLVEQFIHREELLYLILRRINQSCRLLILRVMKKEKETSNISKEKKTKTKSHKLR